MATVSEFKNLLTLLETAGLGDELIEADHEQIFLPGAEDLFTEEQADELGIFWDDGCDCWSKFV